MFEEENKAKNILMSTLIGTGLTLGSSLVLLLICGLTISLLPAPGNFSAAGVIILYVSCIIGGFVAKIKSENILSSLFSGIATAVLILLLSMTQSGASTISPLMTVVAYLAIIATFLAGGFIHTLFTSKRPIRRRKRRR